MPRALHLEDAHGWFDKARAQAWVEVDSKVRFLNELLSAGVPWNALRTVRHSPGLFGAIVEAADQRRLEALRPYRSPTPDQAA